ncbi:MAG: hypothetical protein H0T89_13760 [Deltaproteobacteria bacterium]|nr:hypothetical protein [Deltaproteobacteria bacterium]MDQ3300309.1 hypothetical protein [Myxococcota bacterium]
MAKNLLPVLLGQEPARARRLFWRYKASDKAAVRDGSWKYLRLGGREYLFDVVKDPRERANLAKRNPEVFARLQTAFAEWNASMLPYTDAVRSHNVEASGITPDRY